MAIMVDEADEDADVDYEDMSDWVRAFSFKLNFTQQPCQAQLPHGLQNGTSLRESQFFISPSRRNHTIFFLNLRDKRTVTVTQRLQG